MSSHREAPQISKDPVADSTDVYAFVSPDAPDTVTLIANYIPLEGPDGARTSTSSATTSSTRSTSTTTGTASPTSSTSSSSPPLCRDPSYFLYNVGPITSLSSPNWNRVQTYSLQRVDIPDGQVTVLGTNLPCPPCNIGPLSTPNYAALATAATRGGNDILSFAGQRAEASTSIWSGFDLGNLRPFQGDQQDGRRRDYPPCGGVNSTDMVNVHSLALQIPIWN